MLGSLLNRVGNTRKVLSRATVLPFLVRCGIAFCGLVAMAVAWPTGIVAGQLFGLLAVIAIYPAVAPRGRGATFSALIVVAGWLIATTTDHERVVLWRVIVIATALYLGHSLSALAAVLPYDAIVNLDVPGLWLLRSLAVVLVSAVLTVIALGLAVQLAGAAFLLATLAGLLGAVAATLLIPRLLRRS